jgi:hypothetical protein
MAGHGVASARSIPLREKASFSMDARVKPAHDEWGAETLESR